MDRLEERIVESFNQNQELSLLPREVIGSLAPKRAGLVDRVNDLQASGRNWTKPRSSVRGLYLRSGPLTLLDSRPSGSSGQAFRGDLSRCFVSE